MESEDSTLKRNTCNIKNSCKDILFCFPQNLAIAEKSGFGFGGINMFSFSSIIIF